ncbi:hypothetical protein Emed_002624 [Eimeria media]
MTQGTRSQMGSEEAPPPAAAAAAPAAAAAEGEGQGKEGVLHEGLKKEGAQLKSSNTSSLPPSAGGERQGGGPLPGGGPPVPPSPTDPHHQTLRSNLKKLLDFVLGCEVAEVVESPAAAAGAAAAGEAQETAGAAAGVGGGLLRRCRCSCQWCDGYTGVGGGGAPSSPSFCSGGPSLDSENGGGGGGPPGPPGPRLSLPEGTPENWDFLREAANTGSTSCPWSLFRVLLAVKVYWVLTSLGKKPHRQLRVFEWERSRNVAFAQILAFKTPPLTLQRLCEVVLKPQQQHVEKLCFSLRKVVGEWFALQLLRVRDGCCEGPSVEPFALDSDLQERVTAANAAAEALAEAAQRLPGVRAGLFLLKPCSCGPLTSGGAPLGAPSSEGPCSCSCVCCKDWLAELLQQQHEQQQQQLKRYSSEGPPETETETEPEQLREGPPTSQEDGWGGGPLDGAPCFPLFEETTYADAVGRKRKAETAAAAAAARRKQQQDESVEGPPVEDAGGGPPQGEGGPPAAKGPEATYAEE